MKSIIKIHLCVLLLTIVSNGVGGITKDEILKILDDMANKNENKNEKENINGVFEPSKGGLLGLNRFSVSYKGFLINHQVTEEITMKITVNRAYSDKELAIYDHLHTIGGDTTFEVYGVPAIFYYGSWGNCGMMAMTLFDPGYQERFRFFRLTETDLLILFREIVRITRYIHGNDVYHGHVHLRQFMFRGKASFIYDFTAASIFLDGKNRFDQYAAREDWKQLLHGMYLYINACSRWSWLGFSRNDAHRTQSQESFFSSLKNDSESNKQFIGLRRVFVEFARYALSDDSVPITKQFYDEPSRVIFEEIERCVQQQQGKPLEPSWMTKDEDNVQASSSSSGRSETRNRKKKSSSSCRHRRR